MRLVKDLDNDAAAISDEPVLQTLGIHPVLVLFAYQALAHGACTADTMLFIGYNDYREVYIQLILTLTLLF